MKKHRNTRFVHQEAAPQYQAAIESDLMQVTIRGRDGKTVTETKDVAFRAGTTVKVDFGKLDSTATVSR